LVQSCGYDRCEAVSRLDHQSLAWCRFIDLIMGISACIKDRLVGFPVIFLSCCCSYLLCMILWWPKLQQHPDCHEPTIQDPQSQARVWVVYPTSQGCWHWNPFTEWVDSYDHDRLHSLSFKSLYHCVVNSIFWT
jgi:hypothetical protein